MGKWFSVARSGAHPPDPSPVFPMLIWLPPQLGEATEWTGSAHQARVVAMANLWGSLMSFGMAIQHLIGDLVFKQQSNYMSYFRF